MELPVDHEGGDQRVGLRSRAVHAAAARAVGNPIAGCHAAGRRTAAPAGSTGDPAEATADTPAGAVQAFYGLAAAHRYEDAWALATPTLREQLQGFRAFRAQFSSVRSIRFHRAEVVRQTQHGNRGDGHHGDARQPRRSLRGQRDDRPRAERWLAGHASVGELLTRRPGQRQSRIDRSSRQSHSESARTSIATILPFRIVKPAIANGRPSRARPAGGPRPTRAGVSMSRRRARWPRRCERPVGSASSAALDEIATTLPAPVRSISLRAGPLDFPDDVAVQHRAPYETRADAIIYRQELAELAHARDEKFTSMTRRLW